MFFSLWSTVVASALTISLAFAMPASTKEKIANKLGNISTHSCVIADGISESNKPSDSVTANHEGGHLQTQKHRAHLEKLILQTLKEVNLELTKSLTEINSEGQIHNAMNDTNYSDFIQSMNTRLTFRAKWTGSVSNLSPQQVVRIKALVRTAGYFYHMQIQNPDDRHIYGSDAPHLQKILKTLQRATCILHNLLPNVDAKALFLNIEIPNSFYLTTRKDDRDLIIMGLTLLDIHHSVKGMTISVEDGTLSIDQNIEEDAS